MAKPCLLCLQRVPTAVRANMSQSAPLARLGGFAGAGCVSGCVSGPQDLRLIRQGLGGNTEGI